MRINLLAKSRGVSKKGNEFGRVTLRFRGDDGSTIKDFFVAPTVLDNCNAGEDDEVQVSLDFDKYGRPQITSIQRVDDEDMEIFNK
ncbi:MAG: hypothetical protein MR407_01375 [Roseburia sp.]|nr:hypothetical protein [Roseburia sp.]